MKSKRTLDFIATMRQHGIKEAVAREILSIMDEREGEQATASPSTCSLLWSVADGGG